MNNKTLFIIFGVVGIIIVVVLVALVYNSRAQRAEEFSVNINQPLEDQIAVNTNSGEVLINDIQEEPILEVKDFPGVVFSESSRYSISYYSDTQGFIITLLDSDLKIARELAEEEFLEALGIDEDDACKLEVSLGVPWSIAADYEVAGINYGLSFCSDGLDLP